jgi:hypothetical protein
MGIGDWGLDNWYGKDMVKWHHVALGGHVYGMDEEFGHWTGLHCVIMSKDTPIFATNIMIPVDLR